MLRLYAILGCTTLLVSISQTAKLPKTWKTCKKDATLNDCLKVAMEEAVHDLANGNPSLGVLPLDPMHFDEIDIEQSHGPVSVKLDFKDLDATGLKDIKLNSIKTDWNDMVVEVQVPVISAIGKYSVNGQVLVLPISGSGNCNLTFVDFVGHGNLKIKEIQKGDKKYYQISSLEFTFDTSHLYITLENLFNGDKALGDNMNVFLNENWPEILAELKPAVAKALSFAFKEIGNRLFSKVPIENITPS